MFHGIDLAISTGTESNPRRPWMQPIFQRYVWRPLKTRICRLEISVCQCVKYIERHNYMVLIDPCMFLKSFQTSTYFKNQMITQYWHSTTFIIFFQPHQATPLNYPLRPLFSVLASTPWERLGTGQCTSWTWPWGHSTACGRTWWCIMRCLLPGGVGFLRTFCFFFRKKTIVWHAYKTRQKSVL